MDIEKYFWLDKIWWGEYPDKEMNNTNNKK